MGTYTKEVSAVSSPLVFGTTGPLVEYCRWFQVVGPGNVGVVNEDGSPATFTCSGGEVIPGVFKRITSMSCSLLRYGSGDPPAPGLVGPMTNADKANLDDLVIGNGFHWNKNNADGSAGATLAEHTIERVTESVTISKIYYTPDAALTGDPTNNATITIKARNGLGGAAATVATLTTTVSWTAFVPVDLGAITNGVLSAGMILTITIAKNAGGVAIPAGMLDVITPTT